MSETLKNLIENKENESIIKMIENKDCYSKEFIWIHGENILHWCAAFNNYELIDYILSNKKLHVNNLNYRFTSPLYYATINNSKEAIEVLLKYNSNTCIRSGFSGELPIDNCNDPEIKEIIKKYQDNFIPLHYFSLHTNTNTMPKKKENFTYYQCILYRTYMYYLSCLNYYHTPHKHTINSVSPTQDILDSYKNESMLGLSKLCDDILKIYIDSLSIKEEYCAACHKSQQLLRCTKCKKARFCNKECQKKVYKYHKYDCK